MAFFLDKNATREELTDAVNYLLANFVQVKTVNPNSGEVTSATTGISGYLYRYLFVKYADSFNGEVNFSNIPTNRLYYGVANSESDVESLVPSDYLWREVPGGMGTTKYFWYSTNGGRQIQTYVGTTKPYQNYVIDNGFAIDLDLISGGLEDLNPPVVDTYAIAKQAVADGNLYPPIADAKQENDVTPRLELAEVIQGKFVDLSYSQSFTGYGNATFVGDSLKIMGDLSNVVKSKQLIIETSTLNGDTSLNIAPNGIGTVSKFYAIGSSSFVDYSFAAMSITATNAKIESGRAGTGTYLPLDFYTSNVKQISINAAGYTGFNVVPSVYGKVAISMAASIPAADFVYEAIGTILATTPANGTTNSTALVLRGYNSANLPFTGSLAVEYSGDNYRSKLVATYSADSYAGAAGAFVVNRFDPGANTTVKVFGLDYAGHPTLEGVTATGATGTGKLVFDTSPTLVTPILGTPTSGNFSTGIFTWPTFNQDTTGKAAKLYASPNAYSFTGINTVSGTSVAVLSGTLPAGSATSTNQWMEVIIDSTSFWIPIWAK